MRVFRCDLGAPFIIVPLGCLSLDLSWPRLRFEGPAPHFLGSRDMVSFAPKHKDLDQKVLRVSSRISPFAVNASFMKACPYY